MRARTYGNDEIPVFSRTLANCGFSVFAVFFEIILSKIKRDFSGIRAYYTSTALFCGLPEGRVPSVISDG